MGPFLAGSQDQKASKMIFVIALLVPALAMAQTEEGQGQCIPGVSNDLLLARCMENTVLGDKAWNATLICSSQTAMRGINNFELNRNAEDETECYSFQDITSYAENIGEAVGCGLMAMGWLDETGSWDWNLTKADLHTLPIHRFRIHRCVNRKVEDYKSGGLNWDTCKSTFDDGQQDFINEFLRDMGRVECIHEKLTEGCCEYLTSPPSTTTGTTTATGTGSDTTTASP